MAQELARESEANTDNFSRSNSSSMSDDIRQLAQAFLLAKADFCATGKSARNDHQKYSYAKIEDIYNAVESALIKNNIIIWHYCVVSPTGEKEMLCTRLVHTLSGQFIEDARLLESEKPGNQAKGSANTYMKKYAVLSLCAIAPEDDDGAEEEKYIAKRATEPCINEIQQKLLQEEIKACANARIIFSNILKFNKINNLNELKASLFERTRDYITKNKE